VEAIVIEFGSKFGFVACRSERIVGNVRSCSIPRYVERRTEARQGQHSNIYLHQLDIINVAANLVLREGGVPRAKVDSIWQ
jgi:hypothetical protein